ncbi:transporter substrate-binding domain-containing protein [Arenimonas sp.]|uniref:transporter substrate-binding domain-containing protein n=1 Tax=Arenimonas sp. TaxID=1872635 RepID=UPI0035B1245D
MRLKSVAAAAFACALCVVAVSALARDVAPVRVGGDPHYPPHHYLDVDGEAAGFDVGVLRAVAQSQQLELAFEFGEWSRTLERLERGDLDVVPMFNSADRQQRFLFSKPFMRRGHLLFGRGGEWIEDPQQLAGRRVAVQFGGMAWEWLINERIDAVLRPVNEESLVLVEVMRGDADFALLPSDTGHYAIAMQGLEGVEPASPAWLERDYAFGINPARPDLVARLDAGLAELEASGELQALRKRWLEPPAAQSAPEWSRWWLVPAVPVLLAGLAYLVAGRRAARKRQVRPD